MAWADRNPSAGTSASMPARDRRARSSCIDRPKTGHTVRGHRRGCRRDNPPSDRAARGDSPARTRDRSPATPPVRAPAPDSVAAGRIRCPARRKSDREVEPAPAVATSNPRHTRRARSTTTDTSVSTPARHVPFAKPAQPLIATRAVNRCPRSRNPWLRARCSERIRHARLHTPSRLAVR